MGVWTSVMGVWTSVMGMTWGRTLGDSGFGEAGGHGRSEGQISQLGRGELFGQRRLVRLAEP